MHPRPDNLVSVLLPAYNHEAYIEHALASLVTQSHQAIELLAWDDGSKDATFQKLVRFLADHWDRFYRIVLGTQTNQGTCVTFNRLLSEARGDYLYFFSSDDIAHSNAIETLVSTLQCETDAVLAVGDDYLIDSEGQRVGWAADMKIVAPWQDAPFPTLVSYFKSHCPERFEPGAFGAYRWLLSGNYIPNGFVIRRVALGELPFFTQKAPLEDWYMMLQLAKRGRFILLDEPLFSYRVHATNTTGDRAHLISMGEKTLRHELLSVIPRVLLNWKPHYTQIRRWELMRLWGSSLTR